MTGERARPTRKASGVVSSGTGLDARIRPDPVPDRAASLRPGLLAATRTGLTPANDDKRRQATTKDHVHKVTSDLLVARKIEARPRLDLTRHVTRG